MNGTESAPAHVDWDAADTLFELRRSRGLTAKTLPRAMRKAGFDRAEIPSIRTIERIEEKGAVPIFRYQFSLAKFFGRPVDSIWKTPLPSERARATRELT